MIRVLTIALMGFSLVACSIGPRASSPEQLYSKNATQARELQVPPDLNEVAEGEQFVLPGNSGGAITRATLLPETADVRFVREAGANYLDIQNAPEEIWPQLQEFFRAERFPISQSEPVAGLISTQWRELAENADRNATKALMDSDATVIRIAFRLERGAAGNTRLFARQQVARNADAQIGPENLWPPSSHDPEKTSELLARLMVFLGVEKQRAEGILTDQAASEVLDDAVVRSTSQLTYLDVYRGYLPAFEVVDAALKNVSGTSVESDSTTGKLVGTVDGTEVTYEIFPINTTSTRIIMDPSLRLSREQKVKFLSSLLNEIV